MAVVFTKYAGEDLGTLKKGDTFLLSDKNNAVYQVINTAFSDDSCHCAIWHSGETVALKKSAVVIPVDVLVTVRPKAFDD